MTEELQPVAQDGDGRRCTVVVGVSATSKSPTALAWAQAQAAQHGGRLVAVRAWRPTAPQATPSGTPAFRITSETDSEADARSALAADVAQTLGPDHLRGAADVADPAGCGAGTQRRGRGRHSRASRGRLPAPTAPARAVGRSRPLQVEPAGGAGVRARGGAGGPSR